MGMRQHPTPRFAHTVLLLRLLLLCPAAGDIRFVEVPDQLLLEQGGKGGGGGSAGVKPELRAAIALRRLLLSHRKEQASTDMAWHPLWPFLSCLCWPAPACSAQLGWSHHP